MPHMVIGKMCCICCTRGKNYLKVPRIADIVKYKGKVKSSSLAYNHCETRDKWLLGRDPDRSWCYLHTSVKLFCRIP